MFEEVDMNSDFDLDESIQEMNCVLARFNDFEARDITKYEAIIGDLKAVLDGLASEKKEADGNQTIESKLSARRAQLKSREGFSPYKASQLEHQIEKKQNLKCAYLKPPISSFGIQKLPRRDYSRGKSMPKSRTFFAKDFSFMAEGDECGSGNKKTGRQSMERIKKINGNLRTMIKG